MAAQALETPRFIRKTRLGEGEYHKNFQKLDVDIIQAITSREADSITPLMSKIYLRLTTAPVQYWERQGVLRFEAEWREGKHVKAWSVLCEMLGVASATASKALAWMHDCGVIGYFSGKNGVGIRIFLNRAANSIGNKTAQRGEKILQFPPASTAAAHGSRNEPALNDSFAVSDGSSDTDLSASAPESGALDKNRMDKTDPEPSPKPVGDPALTSRGSNVSLDLSLTPALSIDEIISKLRSEIEPAVESAARRAVQSEHERTREWLESRGLPKAARVAQREAYNVLRQNGVISAKAERTRAELDVGRSHYTPEAKLLSADDIKDLAEMCVAMLDTHGQSIDATLSEISAEAGGFLLAEDAPKVRDLAESLVGHLNQRRE